MESSVRVAEESVTYAEGGDVSVLSDISAIGGGALHEMPRLANVLLQQTKKRLEKSRNLNRDIKEAVVCGLHGLHEMILRLADSRNRHIAEKEKQRANYEGLLAQRETKYSAALESFITGYGKVQGNILEAVKASHKEAETARWLFLESEALNKDNARTLSELTSKLALARA